MCTLLISSVYCPLKEMFCDIFIINCPRQKRFRAHNLAAVWGGIVSFFGEEGNPPPKKKMPEINTADKCKELTPT